MPPKSLDAPKARLEVKFVVFNGPAQLEAYGNGFVNRIDLTKDKPMVLVNSAEKTDKIVPMFVEEGVLVIGADKFPLNGGKIVQFR